MKLLKRIKCLFCFHEWEVNIHIINLTYGKTSHGRIPDLVELTTEFKCTKCGKVERGY